MDDQKWQMLSAACFLYMAWWHTLGPPSVCRCRRNGGEVEYPALMRRSKRAGSRDATCTEHAVCAVLGSIGRHRLMPKPTNYLQSCSDLSWPFWSGLLTDWLCGTLALNY